MGAGQFSDERNVHVKLYIYIHKGGAVASWLVCSTPDRVVRVWVLAGGHCVVFLGKTLYSHGASLHPGV